LNVAIHEHEPRPDDPDPRVAFEHLKQSIYDAGCQLSVRVQKHEVSAGRVLNRLIYSGTIADILGTTYDGRIWELLLNEFGRCVLRCVVQYNDFA
jgi:hypothetical protein